MGEMVFGDRWAARGARSGTRRRRLLLTLCVSGVVGAALGCASTTAPPAIPDTPAGRVFLAWLDAYNAADSARLEAYARQYEPAMSVHTQLVFRAQTGHWALASVERSDLHHLEVTLRTRANAIAMQNPITMYGVVDVADGTSAEGMPRRATTSFTLVGRGPWTPMRRVSAAQRAVTLDSLAAKVARSYVFPDVGQRVADSLRARRARGAYDDDDTEIRLAQRLNSDLLELGGDKQLGVEYAWRVPLPPPVPVPPAMLHCGFESAKVLEGGVGYVRFYGFREPERDCGHEVSEAMNAVAGARALIIDLRENGGGSVAMMAYLASYLVASCTHLGDVWGRTTGRTEALWTRDGLAGPAFGGTKPLYLLTSARTYAAAEELAYDLQVLGRATVVGETTGGGAHTTAVGQIGEHLLVRVPVARAINPMTGTNWHGVGIAPDVQVPASEALATAQRLIRERHVLPASPTASASADRLGARPLAGIDGERAGPARGGARPAGPRPPLRGIRFAVDTLEARAVWRGPLTRVAGLVEFAAGRGRLDVTAVRQAPVVALNGIAVAEPLARPGDYYLFDNAGFILVRPATRTFSSVAFTRAEFNHTGALLPGAFMMPNTAVRTDTLTVGAIEGRRQHAPVSIHWHMQPPGFGSPGQMYARGWLELQDAPAVEAGVARWFEVAAALTTRPGGVRALAPDGVEVTSIVLLRRPGMRASSVRYSEMLAPLRLTAVDVEPARLVLPAGYTETRWPGVEHAPGLGAPSQRAAVRWHTLEDAASQRGRATCRQAWLPELHGGAP